MGIETPVFRTSCCCSFGCISRSLRCLASDAVACTDTHKYGLEVLTMQLSCDSGFTTLSPVPVSTHNTRASLRCASPDLQQARASQQISRSLGGCYNGCLRLQQGFRIANSVKMRTEPCLASLVASPAVLGVNGFRAELLSLSSFYTFAYPCLGTWLAHSRGTIALCLQTRIFIFCNILTVLQSCSGSTIWAK